MPSDIASWTAEDLYDYEPSLAAAATAVALFGLGGIAVCVLTLLRRYRYVHLVTATAVLEAVGYAAMVVCVKRSSRGSIFLPFIVQQMLALLSPNVIQAAMYVTLGWVLRFSPELAASRRWLQGRKVSVGFVLADVLSLVVQAGGMGIYATSLMSDTMDPGTVRLGCGVTLAGLAMQLAFFAVFTWLAVWTHRHPLNGLAGRRETPRLFAGLYLAMAFLSIRNIFRFVEFAQQTVLGFYAPDAYVIAHQQGLLFGLDALPILLCVATYALLHPGWLLPAGSPQQVAASEAAGAGEAAEAGKAAAAGGVMVAVDTQAISMEKPVSSRQAPSSWQLQVARGLPDIV
ncbi:hypothetical protein ABPG75_004486 [Micractinium tetrahymenae]